MEFSKKTERKAITVQELTLQAISPYAAGHVLTEKEAGVLNQTLAENLRNNFAGAVKAAVEKAGSIGKVDVAKLQQEFDTYMTSYSFGVRTGGGGFRGDPVATEARKAALELVKGHFKKKGIKLSGEGAPSKETWNAAIEKVLAKRPDLLETAKKVVKLRQETAGGSLGLDD